MSRKLLDNRDTNHVSFFLKEGQKFPKYRMTCRYVALETPMPSFYIIFGAWKFSSVEHVPQVDSKKWRASWCNPTISTNVGVLKILQKIICMSSYNTIIVSNSFSNPSVTSPAGHNVKACNILMCRANSSSCLYLWDKPRCWICFQIFAERW